MPTLEKIYEEKVTVDANGNVTNSEIIETEIEVPTSEELIAKKEAELLKVYADIEALKAQ